MILLWERYVSAMMFLWGRIHSAVWWLIHGPTKPKKERLLSPWEIAAIEIECGIEPSWTPPPVASLVTRPGGVIPMPRAYLYDPAKDGPIIYLSPTARKGERR